MDNITVFLTTTFAHQSKTVMMSHIFMLQTDNALQMQGDVSWPSGNGWGDSPLRNLKDFGKKNEHKSIS